MTMMRRLPRWAFVCAALGLVPVLVVGTLGYGLRISPFDSLPGLPRVAPLDYLSRPAGGVSPLSERFVADVLGLRPRADGGLESTPRLVAAGFAGGAPAGAERITDVHPLTNDDIADAREVPSVPFTAKTDTRAASREGGEPEACGRLGSSTVWYRYSPAKNIGLIATTFGSNYSTTLGVFSGDMRSVTSVGCDTDARGDAIVAFPAQAGTTYYFQIVGPAGGGDLVFNLDPQGVTRMVSVSTSGEPSDASSHGPSISRDGRFVAFESSAANLGPGTTAEGCPSSAACSQVFLRDTERSTTTIVSVSSSGAPSNLHSAVPSVSGSGRYVAFESDATNLVPGDTNNASDIFVHDLVTRRTRRVSVSSSGEQLQDDSTPWPGARQPSISWDGRFVAFETRGSNLVPEDNNATWDTFVHDRLTGQTERVSVSSSGEEREARTVASYVFPSNTAGNDQGRLTEMTPSISGDGRYVAFRTIASNLVPGDTNDNFDMFVHDRLTHMTERVSVSSSGAQGEFGTNAEPVGPKQTISFDGRYVVFTTPSSNLVSDDTNTTTEDVFVHDRRTHRTIRASVASSGEQMSTGSTTRVAVISADGRYVAFHSDAPNLVPGDTNGIVDVFVHDTVTRTTVRVSVTATGEALDGSSSKAAVSADGSRVTFQSAEVPIEHGPSALVTGQENYQVFVHERPSAGG